MANVELSMIMRRGFGWMINEKGKEEREGKIKLPGHCQLIFLLTSANKYDSVL
jgi:hypothetical protein